MKMRLRKIAMSADEVITWSGRAKSTRVAQKGALRKSLGGPFLFDWGRISKIQTGTREPGSSLPPGEGGIRQEGRHLKRGQHRLIREEQMAGVIISPCPD